MKNPLSQHQITKRQFLKTTAATTLAALVWEPLISIGGAATASKLKLRRLKLNGDWQVSQAGKNDWIPVTVPGCVHTDLLASQKIPDPFYRDNENAIQWVGQSDWIYRRAFDAPEEILSNDKILLRCEGLDTLATTKINGTEIGRADNMFRLWEFDVKSVLRAGKNEIEITFVSPFPLMRERYAARPLFEWIGQHEPSGRAYVRKEPCSFGWDWGPVLPGSGIWRNISLETFNQGRIADVLILQNHSGKNVSLDVEVNVEIVGETKGPFHAALTVWHGGKSVAQKTVEISGGKGRGGLKIPNPKLWWPNGMGGQPLYDVHVELLDAGGKVVDVAHKRIGLRELKVILPENGNPLQFAVNGLPFFAKGGNWIPCDAFTSRITPEILRRYVADAAAVNMNFLRFWGGGYYEDDALFDACDELGICVWLDFKFACSAQPAFDDAFMANVRREARDQLRRLRHHPGIAVWCGNNEISLMTKDEWSDKSMGRADYDRLFKDLIAQQVAELAPQANYVSGSPDCGDTHYWEVWHGPNLFDAYRTLTGFMSEFGFQSFPAPKTVRAFTNEADRASVTSPVMNWHQRDGSGKGNEIIRDTTLRYFRPPKDFDSALWLSQILQGLGIKTGAEYWRQTMPKSMGCIFWQYNDTWPGMSWSSVDYFGRWKALHYLARKFYAPVLISGLENAKDGTIELFVTSDLLESRHGKLSWNVTDLAGKTLAQDSMSVEIPSRKSEKIKTLNLQEQIQKVGVNNLLTWLKLEVGGKTVSENLILLALPKELKLLNPKLAASVKESGGGFLVTIKSENPALWVWLDLENADAKYADNFFHLPPGASQTILVQPGQPLGKDDFIQQLQVRSLFDTYLPT